MKTLRRGRRLRLLRPDGEESLTASPPETPAELHTGGTQIATLREKGRMFPLITPFSPLQHWPTSQSDRLYKDVHGVKAHVFWIWLLVGLGGKKGPGKRNPPILTSCFCWKGDLNTHRAHQHWAQCSPHSPGNSVFAHRAAHHTESACQHQKGWSFPNDRWRVGSKANPIQQCCLCSRARGMDKVTPLQEVYDFTTRNES